MNNRFGVRILNLQTGSIQSCSHEKIRLLNLEDLIATNINSKAFWSISDLLQKRGYFRRGKSRVCLNLLGDSDDCTGGSMEDDCQIPSDGDVQPAENGANSEVALVGNNLNSQPLTFQPQEESQLGQVLTAQEQEEMDQENNIGDLINLYAGEDQDTSGAFPNSQGTTDTNQIDTDVFPEVLQEINPENPVNRNLGETRAPSRYGLRIKPTRNKKYYATELGVDYKLGNLRGTPDEENSWTRKKVP